MSKGILILKSFKTASVLGFIALVLICLPENQTDSIRNLVRESFVPGSEIITWVKNSSAQNKKTKVESSISNKESDKKTIVLETEIELLKSRFLKLKSQNIKLNHQISSFHNNGKPEFKGKKTEPLFIPNLLEARILGKEITNKPYAKQILKIGSREGVSKENLVLEAEELLVDQGNQQGISVDQMVLTGRTLLGRITQAGLHTSTLQLITDPGFRSRVHIYPAESDEPSASGEGVLTGSKNNDYCILKFVPTTQPVSVGDDIYTKETTGSLPSPVYIGKIVEASHQQDEQFWSIKVQPAMKNRQPDRVQVLRTIPNPKRLSAKLESE